jgi:hypothetical protein
MLIHAIVRMADGALVAVRQARVMSPTRRRPPHAPVLRAAAPDGPGWVRATVARRTYRRRLGFAQGDLALSAEGSVLVLRSGWRFVGFGPSPPLVEVIEEGWIPRPAPLQGPDGAG